MESTSESAPLSAPMAIDTWLSAADGDASGLWFMSLLARMAFPESFTWGEVAAVSRADTSAADRYFARGPHRKDSILGNAGTEFLYGGGGLTHAFPPAPDRGEYTRVQDSDVETLLVGGTLDFATPPKFATAGAAAAPPQRPPGRARGARPFRNASGRTSRRRARGS